MVDMLICRWQSGRASTFHEKENTSACCKAAEMSTAMHMDRCLNVDKFGILILIFRKIILHSHYIIYVLLHHNICDTSITLKYQ